MGMTLVIMGLIFTSVAALISVKSEKEESPTREVFSTRRLILLVIGCLLLGSGLGINYSESQERNSWKLDPVVQVVQPDERFAVSVVNSAGDFRAVFFPDFYREAKIKDGKLYEKQ